MSPLPFAVVIVTGSLLLASCQPTEKATPPAPRQWSCPTIRRNPPVVRRLRRLKPIRLAVHYQHLVERA